MDNTITHCIKLILIGGSDIGVEDYTGNLEGWLDTYYNGSYAVYKRRDWKIKSISTVEEHDATPS